MTNTTDTYWDVDGVSLQTYAQNIITLGGDRAAPTRLRGDDALVPYVPGTRWLPKVPDARTITLGMWVSGANSDGTAPTDASLRMKYDQNWRALVKLLWQPNRQFTLTKRFWVPEADLVAAGVSVSGLPVQGGYRLYTASALASYGGGLNPSMSGPARAAFTVDLLLSDPFFYSAPISINFSTATGGSNPGLTRTTTVLGDYRTTAIEMDFTGPLTSPRFTNSSEPQSLYTQYSNVVAAAESAALFVQKFAATHFLTGSTYRASGYVTHAGDRFWLYLDPGSTTLVLSTQAGTGTAVLKYQPRWH